jgi:hypothetical protein
MMSAATDSVPKLYFDFHGVSVEFHGDCAVVLENLRRDFSYFYRAQLPAPADIVLRGNLAMLPSAEYPQLVSADIRPRCTVYTQGSIRWVSYYQGEGLSKWDFASERGEIWSEDASLLHELSYLLILSRSGELLDARGFHRLHAAAVEIRGRAIFFVLPSGGGKSTLLLSLMERPDARLLSDDMPIITRGGFALPFPSRLGFQEPPAQKFGAEFIRTFERREHGLKYLLDAEVYAGRISEGAPPEVIVFGLRRLNGAGRVTAAGRLFAVRQLLASLVFGVGLPQLLEYFLRMDIADVFRKTRLVLSRTIAAGRLLRQAEAYVLELGPDKESNMQIVHSFLDWRLQEKADSPSPAEGLPRSQTSCPPPSAD